MKTKITISFFIALLLLVVFFFIGIQIGSYTISITTIFDAITNYNADNNEHFVLIELRLPRLVISILTGGLLAMSGYLMQSLVHNPLADPYLLGTSSGASLGASLAYSGIFFTNIFTISLFSFIGAMAATLVSILIANRKGNIEPSRLILSGLALSALMVSCTSLLMYWSGNDNTLKNIIYWTMGGFELSKLVHIPLLGLTLAIVGLLFYYRQKDLNVLLLGEDRSKNLGLNVKKIRWLILIAVSAATGLAVSVAGPIGFVGLIIPHFVRSIYGVAGKYTILFTILWGGVFLLVCDVTSRLVFPPTGVPLGIVTSIVGIPFFVYLISQNKFKF